MPSTGEGGDAADSRGLTVRIRVSEMIARYMLKAGKGRGKLGVRTRGSAKNMPSQLARNGITFLGAGEMKIQSLVATALGPVPTDTHASRESCSTAQ